MKQILKMEKIMVGEYEDLSYKFTYKSKKQLDSEVFKLKNLKLENKSSLPNYYVYMYMHPGLPGDYVYGNFKFSFAPIYVGKGRTFENYERLYSHLYYKSPSNLKQLTIEKIKTTLHRLPIIIKVVDNVSEPIAFDVENYLITNIGRIENHTGILTNIQRGHKTEWEKNYEKL